MKITSTIALLTLATALSGCIHSHRQPAVVYTPAKVYAPVATTPTTTTTVVTTPTSDRQVVRVYPEPSPTVVESGTVPANAQVVPAPAPAVSAADINTGNTIRKMLETDSDMAATARGVRISVLNGRVTLTGTMITDQDRAALPRAISTT